MVNPEKNVPVFYNKFIPVNRMHCIKYSVYSSLRNSGFCRRSVALCSTVLSQHTFTRVIYKFTSVKFLEIRHKAQAHITFGALIHCALYLAARRTQTAAELGWWLRWPRLVVTTLESQNICCGRTWSSNQSGGGAILALSSFLNQIPRQKEPDISVGIFSPTWNNSNQLLSTVRSRKFKNNFVFRLKVCPLIEKLLAIQSESSK